MSGAVGRLDRIVEVDFLEMCKESLENDFKDFRHIT